MACMQERLDGLRIAVTPLLRDLGQRLSQRGYATLAPGTAEAAESIATVLGNVLLHTEVRLNAAVSTYLCQPGPIPPHTDHPVARYVLWYCHVAERDGPNRLVDARVALDSLPAVHRARVERLRFSCPALHGGGPPTEHQLWDAGRQQIFFAPWCARHRDIAVVQEAEALFMRSEEAQHSILLEAGQALLIDNHRLLHFRDALPQDSRRWLSRWWIAEHPERFLGSSVVASMVTHRPTLTARAALASGASRKSHSTSARAMPACSGPCPPKPGRPFQRTDLGNRARSIELC